MHATLFINYFEHFSQIILFLELRYAIATQFAGYKSLDKDESLSRKVRCYLTFNKINNELLLKLKDRTTTNLQSSIKFHSLV